MLHGILYIDPGSGSYLVQVIVAGVLGIIFFFKNIWTWIKSVFSRSPKNPNDNSSS
ncbi:MAG: hypothetical protein IT214_02920 [Chitinophagaceae bacterium]|jgi:hypothetical protein|nr:hypothetical protein [Chitinophagaceae bacterium]